MASVPDQVGVSEEDVESIRKVALDYLEGYVSADSSRHLNAYHPEAIKRRYTLDDGVYGITSLRPKRWRTTRLIGPPAAWDPSRF